MASSHTHLCAFVMHASQRCLTLAPTSRQHAPLLHRSLWLFCPAGWIGLTCTTGATLLLPSRSMPAPPVPPACRPLLARHDRIAAAAAVCRMAAAALRTMPGAARLARARPCIKSTACALPVCSQLARLISRHTWLYTEMVVDSTILHTPFLDKFLWFPPEQRPIVCQLGGSNPEQLARAAKIVEGYGYDEINLNCGGCLDLRGVQTAPLHVGRVNTHCSRCRVCRLACKSDTGAVAASDVLLQVAVWLRHARPASLKLQPPRTGLPCALLVAVVPQHPAQLGVWQVPPGWARPPRCTPAFPACPRRLPQRPRGGRRLLWRRADAAAGAGGGVLPGHVPGSLHPCHRQVPAG